MKRTILTLSAVLSAALLSSQPRTSITTLPDWQFRSGHDWTATSGWKDVRVPHDWAISGPFDRSNDIQEVSVKENGETIASVKTGRTGGLPWMGKGCYRTELVIPESESGKKYYLLFDGAMSEPRVIVNKKEVGEWKNGYNAFCIDITGAATPGRNEVVVLLDNKSESSRWYPGAGLYRKVRFVSKPQVNVPVWGTYVTTPYVSGEEAIVNVKTAIDGLQEGEMVTLETVITDPVGTVVATKKDTRRFYFGAPLSQTLKVKNPSLWSPESPSLYNVTTVVRKGGTMVLDPKGIKPGRQKYVYTEGTLFCDEVTTRFGIRSIEVRSGEGFFLNGRKIQFKGVCLHHDLGPLGAAVNRSAIRHQLTMLKDMGCNAVRTSHNMPAEDLVELCDEMGIMLMVESFDEWEVAKCANGYHRFFNDWAEKDMVAMVRHFRNNPSVMMWSIGNEIPTQKLDWGYETARFLQDICHREDPTRPVTCGMNQFEAVLTNGFASVMDIPGINYRPERLVEALPVLPQDVLLSTESASAVSSRGVYHFPVSQGPHKKFEDHQSSSYDVEYCKWSNIPDDDFAVCEDVPNIMGQFVWTGFDYLGEPTPYDVDSWPNHSSVFGIIDLASIPKDRYYLYRSVWNTESPTLHVLPHWTWPGREGQVTPVFVYTSYPSAELFVNGKSQGRLSKQLTDDVKTRYRLMWNDVVYQKGEIKVVAYDSEGNPAAEKVIRTAGKAAGFSCEADRKEIKADGEDLAYVTVSVVDASGNLVPSGDMLCRMKISGPGEIAGVANGDPTSLEPFQACGIHPFGGQFTFIVRSTAESGTICVEVTGDHLKKEKVYITAK